MKDGSARRGLAAAAFLGATAAPLPIVAQTSADTVSYHHEGAMIDVELHRDSLGVVAAPGAREEDLEEAVAEFGLDLVRADPGGMYVVGLPGPSADRRVLFELGRTMYQQRPDLVENAGPLGRLVGSEEPIAVTDQFFALFRHGASEPHIDSLVAAHDAELLEVSPFEGRLRLFRVTGGSAGDVFETTGAFWLSPLTEWAYPDFVGAARNDEIVPNDPHFGEQWHLKNGSTGATGDINATLAWDITMGSPDVVIAVTEVFGFDPDHPDLQPNLWVNDDPPGDVDGDGDADDDGNGYVDDVHGWNFQSCVNATTPCDGTDLRGWGQEHGTAVAGLIAAATDNGIGVAGVCPKCRLMLLVTGGGEWRRVHAFLYARNEGADVVNASWSMNRFSALESVIRTMATDGRNGRGIPVVFSAGNNDEDVCVPPNPLFPSMDEVISVSSSDEADRRIGSTGHGDCLDLLAPGGYDQDPLGIATTDKLGGGYYNDGAPPWLCDSRAPDFSDPDYTRCFGGTSAAAAIVSGVIGLMLSRNPLLTRHEVRDILIRTAEKVDCAAAQYDALVSCPSNPLAFSTTHGFGRVDAHAAVQEAEKAGSSNVTAGASDRTGVELGARAGWTDLAGGQSRDVGNAPGGGPAAEPVFHLAWFPGGSATQPTPWMLELQLGAWRSSTSSPPTDQSSTVAALQASYLFSASAGSPYAAANFAVHHADSGGSSSTHTGWGVAVGYRHVPTAALALRAEARYRHWSQNVDEIGLSLGFGVLIN